jgi:parallel beta-helix repeat protein
MRELGRVTLSVLVTLSLMLSGLPLLSLIPTVSAQNPSCGDTITVSTTLTADIGPCSTLYGISLGASNIVLDCAGHTITGSGTYGVEGGNPGDNARNCNVVGFGYGIYLYDLGVSATGDTVTGHAGLYPSIGILIEQNGGAINLIGNMVNGRTYGFYISGQINPSSVISGNTANSNGYGFYFMFVSSSTIARNTADNNSYGFYVPGQLDEDYGINFTGNIANNNKYTGFSDLTTGSGTSGTSDTYVGNSCSGNGLGSSPAGLCSAPPTLSVSISPTSASIQVGQAVSLTAYASGGTGSYTDYAWHWSGTTSGTFDSGTSGSYSFSPPQSGSYQVWVVVTDSSSATASSPGASVMAQSPLAPDFLVSIYPSTQSIALTEFASFQISANPLNTFDHDVTFSLTPSSLNSGQPCSAPTGRSPTCAFGSDAYYASNSTYSTGPGQTAFLTVQTSSSSPTGTFTLTIRAACQGCSIIHEESVTVSIEALVGVQNVVSISNLNIQKTSPQDCTPDRLSNHCFAIQQNLYVSVPGDSPGWEGDASYWVQNIIYMRQDPLSGQWGGTYGWWIFCKNPCVKANANVTGMLSFTTLTLPTFFTLTTEIIGNQITMTNNFGSYTWATELPSGSTIRSAPYFLTSPKQMGGPEIVLVGPGGGQTVSFTQPTLGYVQSFVKVSGSTWTDDVNEQVVNPSTSIKATQENSKNLEWVISADRSVVFGESTGAQDQGVFFIPAPSSTVSLSSPTGTPGGSMVSVATLAGGGMTPGKAVKVLFGTKVVSTSCFADANGMLGNCAFAVPDLPAGTYTVTLSDPANFTFTIVPSVSLAPVSGPVGTTVLFRGAGFAPLHLVTLASFGSSGSVPLLGTCKTNALGMLSGCRFKVPASPDGIQTLTFSDGTNNATTSFEVGRAILTCAHSFIAVGAHTLCRFTYKGSKPTGEVSWSSDGGSFSTPQCVLSRGSCSVVYTPSSAGSSSVTAAYGGDSNNSPGNATIDLEATWKATKTVVSCTPRSATAGSQTTIICTARVAGYLPTGVVSWWQSGFGSILFNSATCTLSTGSCSVSMTGVTPGNVVLHAVYSGDSNNLGSYRTTTLTVKTAK